MKAKDRRQLSKNYKEDSSGMKDDTDEYRERKQRDKQRTLERKRYKENDENVSQE